jgi:hypothetical protein
MDQLFGSSVHEEESAREAAMDAYHVALANDYDGLRSIKREQYGSFRFIWIQQI